MENLKTLMRAGELYDAEAPLLQAERRRAKDLCFAFNHTRPSDQAAQQAILAELLGAVGADCTILAPFWCDYGYNIFTGKRFFANHGCVILDAAPVRFGDHVFIAPDCGFYTAGHPLEAESRRQGLEYARPISVGDNVWFGAGVKVLPGVRIGSHSVIAAGSVVNRDVADHVLVAGVPGKVIRKL